LVYAPLFPRVYETHGNKTWVGKITSQTGDMPVVIENSYRMTSMFTFYSGIPSFSLNNLWYRQNQYSIDQSEEVVRGQKVLYVSKFMDKGDISFAMPNGTIFYGVYIDPFESYRKLKTQITSISTSEESHNPSFSVYNPYSFTIPIHKLRFGLALMDRYKKVLEIVSVEAIPKREAEYLAPLAEQEFEYILPDISLENATYLKIVISENGFRWGLNGEKLKID
jgi:hypothetical protein